MGLIGRRSGQPLTAEEHVGHYGPGALAWDEVMGESFVVYDRIGVVVDHLTSFEAAGGRVRTSPGGTLWAVLPDGRVAGRVLCGEIIPIATEDGPSDGRCGLPVDVDGRCPAHD